ncbi:site-specific integrase [Amycolatopsis japonica]|uniref:tyrosine-type recombinase/integrase n=1 Tax=Amycolatopsis japonica TaxID=208439 RepID=UPI00331FCBD2
MTTKKAKQPPLGVELKEDIEELSGGREPFRARVRWKDPATGRHPSLSKSHITYEAAVEWIAEMRRAAAGGLDLAVADMSLAEYGDSNMKLALRGLEPKTLDPYLAGWRKRVVPTLGHIPVRMTTYGVVDRAVLGWISDGLGKSVIKNRISVLVRVMDQARRDDLIQRNPAQITGWQRQFHRAEDELDDPRALALPDWATLSRLADALVEASHGQYIGWGEVVLFAGCTGARIGEISGCRVGDIDRKEWIWKLRRQTTPSPGGLMDKATKGKRARDVPVIGEIRELVERRIALTDGTKEARLFTGPKGGRITTAVLCDATSWDQVVTKLGFEHLRRHDLRHTAFTWFADAGVPIHHLQKIAGHGQISTTQRYLHPSRQTVTDAGALLSNYLQVQDAEKSAVLARSKLEPSAELFDLASARPGERARAVARGYLRRTGQLPNVPELVELAGVSCGTAFTALREVRERPAM